MERYPLLPQIYDDGELHIDDIKLAIDYIRVNRINERVLSTSAHNWRLIGSLTVHAGSK
jgi:sporulation-control protein spo0M